MKLVGELVRVRRRRLYLPWFHRVAPSLRSATVLHGVLMPGKDGADPELYLSPLPPQSWTDIWQLQCEFIDRPGLLAELTALLGDPRLRVNILAEELMTLRHQDETVAHVNLVCDLSGYGGRDNPDGATHDRRADPNAGLQYLLDYLAIEFWKDLRYKAGRPQLFASRLRELQHAGRRAREQGLRPFSVSINRGVIEVPEYEWDRLVASGERWRRDGHLVTVASDTEDRYVKVTPLSAEREHLLLEVLHEDRPGQIRAFTALLQERFPAANIVSSYLRLVESGGPAVWRCLLEAEPGRYPGLKTSLAAAFEAARPGLGDRTLRVTFPRPLGEGSEPIWRRLATWWEKAAALLF